MFGHLLEYIPIYYNNSPLIAYYNSPLPYLPYAVYIYIYIYIASYIYIYCIRHILTEVLPDAKKAMNLYWLTCLYLSYLDSFEPMQCVSRVTSVFTLPVWNLMLDLCNFKISNLHNLMTTLNSFGNNHSYVVPGIRPRAT